MEQKIIGRKREQEIINSCLESGKAEFVAVYGRHRIGKTFLVKQCLKDKIDFYVSGQYEGHTATQLKLFNEALLQYSGHIQPLVQNWHDAFLQLTSFITQLHQQKEKEHENETVVIFIDELPWFDTHKSNFKQELDLFWNTWASEQPYLKIFVCGSATTWMTKELIGDKGGLHNRITRQIYLSQFSLGETEQYLKEVKGIEWNRYTIIELYMILGGTPYYLSLLEKGMTMSENIDFLFFSATGELRKEYDFLFRSLFNDSQKYRAVIETLCNKNKGLTRKEIVDSVKISDGGSLSEILDNLCSCDFIRPYYAFGKKQRDVIYQLIDHYTRFYLKFVKDNRTFKENYWSLVSRTPKHAAWSGYAFEQVCLSHLPQIRKAIGISGVLSDVCSWAGKDENKGGQIDLLLDRDDNIINLCEMKYSATEYEVVKSYAETLLSRRELFRATTKTKKALHLTMISPYGLKKNAYSDVFQSQVTGDELFEM